MQERGEALDFIYKGWRDGRQNRRDVRTQRGQDRMASRRQFMGGMNRQPQSNRMRGPPSANKNNVASSPPSAEWVNPVDQIVARNATAPQSTTAGNFTDDVTTPDDESTPQNEAVSQSEVVGSPPSLETSLAHMGSGSGRDPTLPKPTQANVVPYTSREDNQPEWMNQFTNPTPAPDLINDPVPKTAEPSPKRNEDLGNRMTNPNADPFPTNYTKLPEEDRQGIITELGDKSHKLAEGTKQYEQAVKDGIMTEGQATNSINQYKNMLYQDVPEEGGYKPEDRTIPEATRSDEPFDPPTREATIPDEIDFGHEPAFNEAYNGMVNDGSEAEAQPTPEPTPEPQPDPTVAEVAPKAAPTKEETAKELFARVQNAKDLREGREPENTVDDSKLDEKGKKAAEMFEEVQARKTKRQAKAKTEMPKTPKASTKGKDAVKERAAKLVAAGMKGEKPSNDKATEAAKKAATGSKKKSEVKPQTQDISSVDSTKPTDYQRSADSLELDSASDLLKRLTMNDLRMFGKLKTDPLLMLDSQGYIDSASAKDPSQVFQHAVGPRSMFDDKGFFVPPKERGAIGLDMDRIMSMSSGGGGLSARSKSDRIDEMDRYLLMPGKHNEKVPSWKTPIPYPANPQIIAGSPEPLRRYKGLPRGTKNNPEGYFREDGSRIMSSSPEGQKIINAKAKSRPSIKGPNMLSPRYNPSSARLVFPLEMGVNLGAKSHELPGRLFGERSIRPLDGETISPFIGLNDSSSMKEILSMTPKEFKARVKGASPQKDRYKQDLLRLGDAAFNSDYIKQFANMFQSNSLDPNQEITFHGGENAPLSLSGLAHMNIEENDNLFQSMIAPKLSNTDDGEPEWTSMNDLFE